VIVASADVNDQVLPWLDAILQPHIVGRDLLSIIAANDAV
jgi:hypothetical protein